MTTSENIIENDIDAEIAEVSALPEMQEALNAVAGLKEVKEESNQELSVNTQEELSEEESEEENKDAKSDKEDISTDGEKDEEENTGKPNWRDQKRYYKIRAEQEKTLAENKQLKELLADSLDAGSFHYNKSVDADLEKAKFLKKKAIDEGDVDALVQADIDLARAINAKVEAEKLVSNQQQSSRHTQNNDNQTYSQRNQEIANDWLSTHPELQPNSKSYNAELASQVVAYANQLDSNLANNNQQHMMFSEEYFDAIENHIDTLRRQQPNVSNAPKSASHIGGVKKSHNMSGSGKKTDSTTKVVLSADEKRMCANAGISEKEWLKYKLEDLKNNKRSK